MPSRAQVLAAIDEYLKALVLRALMRLPERVLRTLAGRPVTIDGQTLAVDVQLMLRLKDLLREPATEDLPLDQGRRLLVQQSRIVGGRQPVAAVSELTAGGR